MNEARSSTEKKARRTRLVARLATPVGLIVLAGLGSAYAYLVDRGAVSDADRASRPTDVFPSFRLEDVRRVKLVQGADEVLLERSSDVPPTWTVTSPSRPEKQTADPAAIDVLLRELELARRVRDVADGQSVGLDPPRVRGQIVVGPLEYAFALGGDAAMPPGSAYMKLEGEGAFVVGSTLKVQLLRGADTYRERAMVSYGASDIARVDVTFPAGAFSIERTGATFRVGEARGLRASRAVVDRLFGALSEVRADFFLDDDVPNRDSVPPVLTVTVAPRQSGRPRIRFAVGAACPSQPRDVIVVRSEPTRTAACVAKDATDVLATLNDALVDRSAFFARADEIEELRLDSLSPNGARVEIARRGTGWRERSPEARDLDADEVDSANLLVGVLANAQATEVRRGRKTDAFQARTRATIVRTGTAATEVLEIAAPDGDGFALARRVDDDALLRLPEAIARRFVPHPVTLRGRTLWPSGFDAANVVAVNNSCGPSPERIELQGGRWIVRETAPSVADAVTITELANAVVHAKADAWLTESDDGSYGLGRAPSCAISLTLAPTDGGSPGSVIGLAWGAEGEGGYYARTLDGSAVFVAPAELHDLVVHPAIDRSRFRLDPTELTGVTLEKAEATLALKGRRGHLAFATGAPDDGDADKLEAALAAFGARDALHEGAALKSEGFDHPTLAIDAIARHEAGPPQDTRIVVGAPGHDGGAETYFARIVGIDATFAVPREEVDAILTILASRGP